VPHLSRQSLQRSPADARGTVRFSPDGFKTILVDLTVPRQSYTYVIWGYDKDGAFVRKLDPNIPKGHGFVTNDALLKVNGVDVHGLSKVEINGIWLRSVKNMNMDTLRLELKPSY